MLEDALSLYYKLLKSDDNLIYTLTITRFQLTMELCEFVSHVPKRT